MHPLLTTLTLLACFLSLPSSTHAQTPSPDDTLRAFRIAEKHIREWTLPPDGTTKTTENADAPKAVGACITLKLRGEVIARGTAWSGAIAGPEAFSNDVLRRAILAAMQQADPKLGVPNDAMRDEAIKLVTPDILISAELAGPLSMVEFNTWDDAEISLRPGLDGVAARLGGDPGTHVGTLHAIFPSQMMLGNMLPHRAMGAVAAKVIGEGGAAAALDDPKKLRDSSGVRMYRFRVGQVVNSGSGCSAALLWRGQRPPMIQVPTRQDIEQVAERLAEHLSRNPPLEVQTAGGILSAGMARRALEGYIAIASRRTSAHSGAISVSAKLNAVLERVVSTPQSNDIVRMTSMARILGRSTMSPTECTQFKSIFMLGGEEPSSRDWRVALDETEKGLYAMTSVETSMTNFCGVGIQLERQRDEACVADVFRTTGAAKLVSQMPWLGWAQLRVSEDPNARDGDKLLDIPSAIALRQMRSDCWKHQLSVTDAGEDAMDMAGGIVFTKGLADGRAGNPYPTWQCVRPLAFIATMLRDPRLTEPQERPEQIVRLMQAARFLRQLQVDEASAWMYPDPSLAIGGIRASTWDNSLPVDATSMTLLFVVELIKSLDELSAAKNEPAAPTTPK